MPPPGPLPPPEAGGGSTNGERPGDLPDFDIILGAPDFTELIKRPQTKEAREYRDKVASGLKMYFLGSIATGNFPDAATTLWYGPGAATAMGDLAASNIYIAKGVDIITSPSSPVAQAIMVLMPYLSQLARNHEKQLAEIPSRFNMGKQARQQRKAAKAEAPEEPPLTLKVGKRRIPIRWRFRPKFLRYFTAGVMSQTKEPNLMAATVFMDPKVQRQLEKMGIIIQAPGGGNGAG
jgi:hypothetical protein